jgi:hypothetical protein
MSSREYAARSSRVSTALSSRTNGSRFSRTRALIRSHLSDIRTKTPTAGVTPMSAHCLRFVSESRCWPE